MLCCTQDRGAAEEAGAVSSHCVTVHLHVVLYTGSRGCGGCRRCQLSLCQSTSMLCCTQDRGAAEDAGAVSSHCVTVHLHVVLYTGSRGCGGGRRCQLSLCHSPPPCCVVHRIAGLRRMQALSALTVSVHLHVVLYTGSRGCGGCRRCQLSLCQSTSMLCCTQDRGAAEEAGAVSSHCVSPPPCCVVHRIVGLRRMQALSVLTVSQSTSMLCCTQDRGAAEEAGAVSSHCVSPPPRCVVHRITGLRRMQALSALTVSQSTSMLCCTQDRGAAEDAGAVSSHCVSPPPCCVVHRIAVLRRRQALSALTVSVHLHVVLYTGSRGCGGCRRCQLSLCQSTSMLCCTQDRGAAEDAGAVSSHCVSPPPCCVVHRIAGLRRMQALSALTVSVHLHVVLYTGSRGCGGCRRCQLSLCQSTSMLCCTQDRGAAEDAGAVSSHCVSPPPCCVVHRIAGLRRRQALSALTVSVHLHVVLYTGSRGCGGGRRCQLSLCQSTSMLCCTQDRGAAEDAGAVSSHCVSPPPCCVVHRIAGLRRMQALSTLTVSVHLHVVLYTGLRGCGGGRRCQLSLCQSTSMLCCTQDHGAAEDAGAVSSHCVTVHLHVVLYTGSRGCGGCRRCQLSLCQSTSMLCCTQDRVAAEEAGAVSSHCVSPPSCCVVHRIAGLRRMQALSALTVSVHLHVVLYTGSRGCGGGRRCQLSLCQSTSMLCCTQDRGAAEDAGAVSSHCVTVHLHVVLYTGSRGCGGCRRCQLSLCHSTPPCCVVHRIAGLRRMQALSALTVSVHLHVVLYTGSRGCGGCRRCQLSLCQSTSMLCCTQDRGAAEDAGAAHPAAGDEADGESTEEGERLGQQEDSCPREGGDE